MTLWLVMGAHGFKPETRHDLDRSPLPSVAATGLGSYRYWLEDDVGGVAMHDTTKPPYRVPSMAEVAAIPWNGLRVASTFSGAGGSCLGYRMAGYRVVWANEFVPIACESYKANAAPDCILDPRDIRTVTADDILAATGLGVGELDLFDGSPPCQAFSTAGKREKGWGKDRLYEHGARQKNEDLFFEYVRPLGGLQPRTFVAENVSGLVKGTAKGYFLDILKGLKGCGYRVTCRVLDAQWLGVPQSRQRAIFVGVREDLDRDPVHPSPLPYRYSVREALPELCDFRGTGNGFNHAGPSPSRPETAVTAAGQSPWNAYEAEFAARVMDDTRGLYGAGDITDRPSPAITNGVHALNSSHFQVEIVHPSGWAAGRVDSIDDPSGAVMARPGGVGGMGPGQTFVQSGTERRKFTIAEVKRLCAFPDDFVLVGSYAQQWERLGNSVPPVMMRHIAEAVRDRVLLA